MNEQDGSIQSPAELNGDAQEPVLPYVDFSQEERIAGLRGAADLVSLHFLRAAIGRKKRVWGAATALGLLLGCALFISQRPVYQASVSVLIVSAPGSDQTSGMETDVLLAEDPAVSTAVVRDLRLHMSASSFLATYSATSTDDQVLDLQSSAPTASLAVSEANTIAAEFLQFRAELLQSQEDSAKHGLDKQMKADRAQVGSLARQVKRVSAQRSSAAQRLRLGQLRIQLAKAKSTLSAIEQQAGASQAESQTVFASMVGGSRILYATPAHLAHGRAKTAMEYIGGGTAGGFFIGLLIVIVGAVTSTKLRRRGDIAEVLGAQVKVSLATSRLGRARGAGHGRGRQAADLHRGVRYLRGLLSASPKRPATLSIVAVDNERDVAALAAALATSLAREGYSVAVADLINGALARQLGAGEIGITPVKIDKTTLTMVLPDPAGDPATGPLQGGPNDGGQGVYAAYAGCDYFVTAAVLRPGLGGDHLGTWSDRAAVVVSAGASTTAMVQSVGEMIRFAGLELSGAILLGADPDDDSLGLSYRK